MRVQWCFRSGMSGLQEPVTRVLSRRVAFWETRRTRSFPELTCFWMVQSDRLITDSLWTWVKSPIQRSIVRIIGTL
jgi:hypothetical protein